MTEKKNKTHGKITRPGYTDSTEISDKTDIDLVGLSFSLRMKITENYVLTHCRVKIMIAEMSQPSCLYLTILDSL